MNILLVARDHHDLPRIGSIADAIEHRCGPISVRIICGSPKIESTSAGDRVIYLRAGLSEMRERCRQLSDAEIARLLASFRHLVPPNIYKADQRFQHRLGEARDLAIEQLHFVERTCALINEYRPEYAFMAAGATLVRNAVFCVARAMGVHVYRLMPSTFLTPGRAGPRFWFCSTNDSQISAAVADKFSHDSSSLARHATELIDSIRSGSFRLAGFARTKRRDRASLSWLDRSRDLVNITVGGAKAGKARRRLRAGFNHVANRRISTDPSALPSSYLLFPLNVPEDAQLTLRAPQFVDLFSLCQQILNVLPLGCPLVLREHPGAPGMLDHSSLRDLLRRNGNAYFLSGDVELRELLGRAAGLITINSTAGLEAAIAGKPVLAFGPAFYSRSGFVYDAERYGEIGAAVADLMADPLADKREPSIHETLCRILDESWPPPGEVRGLDPESIDACMIEGICRRIEQAVAGQ